MCCKCIFDQKKLAKGKPIANEDMSDDSEVFTAASEELQAEGVNEMEVEFVIEALKLTQENDSDIDSDFEDFDSDEESDLELVW